MYKIMNNSNNSYNSDAQKIILYICPGHQLSEFVPWLINHSPEMDHGKTFSNDWTDYESSYGFGKEPIESHWSLPSSYTRTYKRHVRFSAEFPAEHFETLFDIWEDRTGTKCIFLNLQFENYKSWVTDCRNWFDQYHPDVDLIIIGHTQHLQQMINPSRFFIKEGYILDEEGYQRDTWNREAMETDQVVELKQKALVQNYNRARGEQLANYYAEAEFDAIWSIEDIQQLDRCKHVISTVVEPPDNFDELYQTYMDLNPPDLELDTILREYMNKWI